MPGRFVDEPYALVLIDDDHAGLHALYHVLRELLHIGEVDAALRGEGLALSRAPREPVREEGGEKKCRAQQTRVCETCIARRAADPQITLLAKYGEGADGGVEHGPAAAHEHAAARERDAQQGAEAAADAAARKCEQDGTDDVDQGLCIQLHVEAGRASVLGVVVLLGGLLFVVVVVVVLRWF